ncbi:unnamed protein product [Caenorhabditis brenneri]
MSLFRPARFPLLKLPCLCIKCVLHNLDEFVIIYFATISDRTRKIVKSSNYPLKEIDICLSGSSNISFKHQLGKSENEKTWLFIHDEYAYGFKFVLKKNSQALRTSRCFDRWRGYHLESYTGGDTLEALKMGIEFMIEVFGCTVRQVFISGIRLSDLVRLGTMSVKKLVIGDGGPVHKNYLKYVMENIKVIDEYVFSAPIPAKFSCDPQIFNCRKLSFNNHSARWVTFEILCQFDVPQLSVSCQRFSVKDIVSYVTYWFNSKNRKLEYLHIEFNNPISLEDFKLDHLNPMPFCEKRRNRWTLNKSWEKTDISSGKDILREDGLLATFFVKPTSVFSTEILFYVWHKRFPGAA